MVLGEPRLGVVEQPLIHGLVAGGLGRALRLFLGLLVAAVFHQLLPGLRQFRLALAAQGRFLLLRGLRGGQSRGLVGPCPRLAKAWNISSVCRSARARLVDLHGLVELLLLTASCACACNCKNAC